MRERLESEGGFGLIELLIAMTVMVVGITALVAALGSGMVTLGRAAQNSTASAVADAQMEGHRKVQFAAITPTYAACGATTLPAADCFVSSTVTGPDGRSYRVDKAISWDCALGTLGGTVASPTCTVTAPDPQVRPAKRVAIAIYDPSPTPAKFLFRETSTFDQSTG